MLSLALLGAQPVTPLFPDSLVARGHGLEVRRHELNEAYDAFIAQEASRGRAPAASQRREAERQVLDRIVATRLLMKRATDDERKKAREKADRMIEESRKEASSETSYRLRLQAMGVTEELTRTRLTEQAICEEVLQRELFSKIRIPEDDLKKHHQTHTNDFLQPEMIKVSHILLATRDRLTRKEFSAQEILNKQKIADTLLVRARRGDDFQRLVENYSDDPLIRTNFGEYTFPRGQMVPEFETAAFALKPGQISNVVTSRYGFHIIKQLARIPAKPVAFEIVAEDVRTRLQRKAGEEKLPAFLDRLRQEARIEILLDPPDSSP